MKTPIIGLDFGNYNSFACFVSDADLEKNRLGGMTHDLCKDGIPSVFFYSSSKKIKDAGTLPWCGAKAVSSQARPVKNRTRLLKRHLGEQLVLDDRTFTYDEAIVKVAEYCIRQANVELQKKFLLQSNLISLSYPSTYTCAQRQRLIELIEKATLENGTKVKVVGTIAEPAAAALDYLAEFAKKNSDTTILTYDLGGGTFDLALVSAYPAGKKNSKGNTYYYDIINTRGLGGVGGSDFDKILFDLVKKKIDEEGFSVGKMDLEILEGKIETNKLELSQFESTEFSLLTDDGYEDMTVTRDEFEKAAYGLIQQTIAETRKILSDHPSQKPEVILLTGGASQMPIVRKELEKALPEYRGKIVYFRPSTAIAYGAARFGAVEDNVDPTASVVQQRTIYDLGDQCYDTDNKLTIELFIPAGTEIPCESEFHYFRTRVNKQQYVNFSVFEAKRANPNAFNVTEDYTEIVSGSLDLGRECPRGTRMKSKFVVDKRGLLTVEAYEVDNTATVALKKTVELKNLS